MFQPLKHGCGFVWYALQSTLNILELLLFFIESKQLVDETLIENLYWTKSAFYTTKWMPTNLMPVHSFPASCDISNLFTCLTFTIKVGSVKPKLKQGIKYLNTNVKLNKLSLMAPTACFFPCLHTESAGVESY